MDAIFAFCVLYFISDTSLFNKIFTNRQSQQILFYSEVSFYQPPFLESPMFVLYRKLLSEFPNIRQDKSIQIRVNPAATGSHGIRSMEIKFFPSARLPINFAIV